MLAVYIFFLVALVFATLPFLLNFFLADSKPSIAKSMPYECGFKADDSKILPFDTRYYLIAILFLLFDIELLFLLPLALVAKGMGMKALIPISFFLFFMLLGFIYEWRMRALELK